MIMRREFLSLTGACISAAMFSSCATSDPLLRPTDFNNQHRKKFPASTTLAMSIRKEYYYETTVECKIPKELRDTLYRNGPGIFERKNLLNSRCVNFLKSRMLAMLFCF
jgi:all-trans-8'-apo-beta-carotenal 15,15'-oxygenase